jgi:protein-S-isoprenylcysteine O-methyltransferase Ste14
LIAIDLPLFFPQKNGESVIQSMSAPPLNYPELICKTVSMFAGYIVALFLPAGTLAWISGWAYVVIFLGFSIGLTAWLIRYDPALMAERLTGLRHPSRKEWDKIFIPFIFVAFFAWLAVMGLDAVRFRWSQMPILLQMIGCALLLTSFYIFYRTFRENTYLSPAVRIQKEREQKVVSTGPYRYVRHPMYAGFGLYVIGTALMLGSWLGAAYGLVLIAAVARRAIFEEETLQRELPGYDDYMKSVRHRLIPGIW